MGYGNKRMALALLSGGLDSILALKLVMEQGVDVIALNIHTPFLNDKVDYAGLTAEKFGIPLVRLETGEEYLEIVRRPGYGYGSGMNPCIDCHIYMLRKAKAISNEVGADFIVTGDVLGERPMSQYRRALILEDKEAGVEGEVLRPLSARLMPETIPERAGWIDRSKLLAISGRSRKPQIALAKRYRLGLGDEFSLPTPSGGCLLTCREFAARLRDLMEHEGPEALTMREVRWLRVGRHFRYGSARIIVGRNEVENEILMQLRGDDDYLFEVQGYGSPVTILRGDKSGEAEELAAKLTVRYSDAPADTGAEVRVVRGASSGRMTVPPLNRREIETEAARFRI